jgi:hypothetical protein
MRHPGDTRRCSRLRMIDRAVHDGAARRTHAVICEAGPTLLGAKNKSHGFNAARNPSSFSRLKTADCKESLKTSW